MNYMYERGRSTVGEWRRLNRGQSSLWCNNHDDTPTVGPVAVFRATWNLPDGYLGVTCANRSGPSVVWAGSGLSRVDQPPLRAVFTRPEVEVYTLRRKGDLEGT